MNKINKWRWIALLLLFVISCPVKAQEPEEEQESRQPVTGIYGVQIGSNNVQATYLSPLTYKGEILSLFGQWSKAMPFNPESAVMQFDGSASISNHLNPAKTARMLGITADFSWDMAWRKRLPCNFQVTAGGGVNLYGGAYYVLRNSNNPVQAIANISLMATASVSYHFKIGNVPVLVSDRVKLPFVSGFFCPGYGETYYEIYLGNHKDLFHVGSFGNNFMIDNLLAVTIDFGRTAMTLGYRVSGYNQWANNLNTRIVTNSFVIGVVPGGIGIKKVKAVPADEKIYSLF